MPRNLDTRIAALERVQPEADPITIIICLVSPGNLHPTCNNISSTDFRMQWTREPGESEQDFTDRASREAKRNEWGNVTLISSEAKEQSHAVN